MCMAGSCIRTSTHPCINPNRVGVRYVRSQSRENSPIVSLDLTVGLRVVRRSDFVSVRHHLAYVDKELRREETSVVCYEFHRRAVVEDGCSHEDVSTAVSGES